jgi:uncharacterized membrane protein
MIATIMSGNVFFVIIPGQRKVVAALRAGLPVDPNHGRRGKQRSVHNTYFTLPVIVAMLSNHYGMLYQASANWLVLILMMLAGALIRLFFVLRHKGPNRYELVTGALVVIGMVAFLAAPKSEPAEAAPVAGAAAAPALKGFAQVEAIVNQRCVLCHNAVTINKNIQLHTPELIKKHAQDIYQQAVVLKIMPFNNATQITEAERKALGAWYEGGAKTE